MGIWIIAVDNIKKKKGNAILLMIMISFAVMMLYVGILVLTNLDRNINERNNLINGSDFLLISSNTNASKTLDEIKSSNSVKYAESEKGLYLPSLKYYKKGEQNNNNTNRIDYLFQKKDTNREISVVTLIDEGNEWTQDSIILPYYMKAGLGYKTGDVISLEIYHKIYYFTVYGFMDDIMFSTPSSISTERVFIDNKMYSELFEHSKQEITIYKAILNKGVNVEDFESSMAEHLKISVTGYSESFNISLNYSNMRMGASITAFLFMGILTAFAIILIVIAMIIINFNISNSIEMKMKEIGILQASGYTRSQLIASTIIETMMIGTLGMAIGLIFAKVTSGIIGGIIAASIGMFWNICFDVVSAIYSILITLIMVFVAAFIGSLKYRKINVLDALRNGIRTHNFKKSYINLDKSILPINIALGIKNILSRKTKNIVIALIIAFLTFGANAALSMYQNYVQDDSNLLNTSGFEVPAIGISFDKSSQYNKQDVDNVVKQIQFLDGVKEIKQLTSYNMVCSSESGSEALNCDAYDDTDLKVDNVVDGKRPQNDDEIMLSTLMAKRLNVSIGDIVYLEMNGNRQDYIVCGLFQGINHLGKKALVDFEGIERLDTNIIPDMLYVYNSNSKSTDDLLNEIKSQVKEDNVTITNFEDFISASLASITSIMKIFSFIIIAAVGLVIALVLIFLVKTQIVKDSRQYGIYKALGYTTGQLLIQMTMNYLPVVITGTVIGCIFSIFSINLLFVFCLSMFGIKKCNMDLGFFYMLFMVVAIILWSQFIIVANSVRIRKIVPCEMIQEN